MAKSKKDKAVEKKDKKPEKNEDVEPEVKVEKETEENTDEELKPEPKVEKEPDPTVEFDLPLINLNVFCQLSGLKFDQTAGFRRYATTKKLAPMTVPQWRKKLEDFQNKPTR